MFVLLPDPPTPFDSFDLSSKEVSFDPMSRETARVWLGRRLQLFFLLFSWLIVVTSFDCIFQPYWGWLFFSFSCCICVHLLFRCFVSCFYLDPSSTISFPFDVACLIVSVACFLSILLIFIIIIASFIRRPVFFFVWFHFGPYGLRFRFAFQLSSRQVMTV